jgi:hypothetical protein
MTHIRYQIAAVLILAASMLLSSCKSTETPAPTASAPAEKTSAPTPEAPACHDCIPVTADNFVRAETDRTFAGEAKLGAFSKLLNFREMSPLDKQVVQRANRDTLYSVGVFDLDAGPVTITLPNAGKRFMTMIVIDEDHYVYEVVYGGGSYPITRDKIGTRYALAAIRILADPGDPKDMEQVHALQDAVKVSQKSPGSFEIPKWDPASQKKVRDALVVLGSTIPDWRRAAGRRDEVDAVRHLIVTATGWGLNPDEDAIYLNITPAKNDGTTIYKLNVRDVPVDGFWSISVYNALGYFVPNILNAYTLNNITATKAPTAPSPSSSAVATARSPTASLPCRVGTTW